MKRRNIARNGGHSYGVLFVTATSSMVFFPEAAEAIPRTVQLMCKKTHNRYACETSLAAHPDATTCGTRGLVTIGIHKAMNGMRSFHAYSASFRSSCMGKGEVSAFAVCHSVLKDAQDHMQLSLSNLAALDPLKFKVQMADTLTWLSSALTDHTTCLEGVNDMSTHMTKDAFMRRADSVTTLLANAVSLVAAYKSLGMTRTDTNGHNRRLLETESPPIDSSIYELPKWMRPRDRKLLQTGTTNNLTIVNAVVAKDGSGNYNTIQAAIDAMPQYSVKNWLIRVKAGVQRVRDSAQKRY